MNNEESLETCIFFKRYIAVISSDLLHSVDQTSRIINSKKKKLKKNALYIPVLSKTFIARWIQRIQLYL